ncbi:MAG: hypothetical protein DRO40_01020 [Thermoprotei archaeon]|nr:MAG: hypothetical protein DRO40_01020 [Thermoprotei archaeon]
MELMLEIQKYILFPVQYYIESLDDKVMFMETYSLPFMLKRIDENIVKANIEEELALLYYFVGSKYDEYFKKSDKRIVALSIIYHPIIAVPVADRFVLLVDPVNKPVHVISYRKPILGNIVKNIKMLKEAKREDFLEALTRIKSSLEEIIKKNENIIRIKHVIEGIIADRSIIDELARLMNYASKPVYEGVELPEKEINVKEIKSIFENILNETSSICETVNILTNELEDTYKSWRERIEIEYISRERETQRTLKEIRRIMNEKISEYSSDFENMKKRIEQKYEDAISSMTRRLKEIEEHIETLRSQLSSKEHKEDMKEIKQRIRELEREREQILRKLEEVKEKSQKELSLIEKQSSMIVKMEHERLRVIEEEAKKIGRELKQIMAKCDIEFNIVKKLMYELRKEVTDTYRNISNLLSQMPPLGAGRYLVPMIAVITRDADGVEKTLISPPQFFVIKKGLHPKYYFEGVTILNILTSNYADMIYTYELKKKMKEKTLITRENIEKALIGLDRLAKEEKDVIEFDEAYKIISRFKELLPK